MKDYLGNEVKQGDTVILAIRSGRAATLSRGFVQEESMRPQFQGGDPTPMLNVKWSNLHDIWLPARHVIKLPDELLPEKRREKLEDVEEGVLVS